jgi:hypothetical protein
MKSAGYQFWMKSDDIMTSVVPLSISSETPISINILIPGCRVCTASVLRSSSIRALKESILNADLIFNGQILSDTQTIHFYGIQPNDSLVVLLSGPRPAEVSRWLQITHDLDTFTNFVQSMMSPSSRMEFLRLQDLRGIKRESRPRCLTKLCYQEMFLQSACSSRAGIFPMEIPPHTTAVSDTPLPVCW